MEKSVTYFVVALAIILGLTYMATQAESCSKKSTTTIHANDISADKERDIPVEDLEEDEPTEEHDDSTGSISSDEDADDNEVKPIDGTEPEYSDAAESEDDETDTAANFSEQVGDYLVIAGSFKSRENAASEVKKLKDLGFPNAEIVEFDFSDFYSVCVARYENSNDAEKVTNSIKNRLGKKAYVHKRRDK